MSHKPCPVCGNTKWTPEYDHVGPDGDEIRDRCDNCDWPPNAPMRVAEYRRWWNEGFPRLADDDGKATEAWKRITEQDA